ncbi:hypothetical protein KRR39_08055 [Nocardioides panacis]|jgi:hypothetical protein|uniref:GntR family transcriptional regulator n=1 Tax=Nocardioides panacis TaxID=2849501 RepID=A0A975Y1M9_9ACTN|nr:hypothetical protein [Nocardioides panacis]QWZ09681.1 hypothetical protein KRR39_08055 [Nocardioides panacis]
MALERKMLRDQIKELVLERILNGTYEPGERVHSRCPAPVTEVHETVLNHALHVPTSV